MPTTLPAKSGWSLGIRLAGVHAVVIRDSRLVWEERDDPVPGDTQVLVAVRAAGINSADLVQRMGLYPAPPGWPEDVPGMEMAGEVVAVGRSVRLWAPGDRAMAVVGGRFSCPIGVRLRRSSLGEERPQKNQQQACDADDVRPDPTGL